MKIVIIHQDLFFQGGQCIAAKLANGLSARGHEVDVIVSKVHTDIQRENPTATPYALTTGVRLHVLPRRRALHNVFALARLLRQLRPDVIVPNVGHYNQCAVLARFVGLLRMPIVYVEHCAISGDAPRGFFGRLKRWMLRQDEMIIAVSEAVKVGAMRSSGLDETRVVRIYNPVLPDTPDSIAAKEAIHPWLTTPGLFKVVSAGALSAGKGFDVLIRAFRFVAERIPEARLVIFGRGVERESLQRQIEESGLREVVTLAGFTDCLSAQLRHADVFAFASRFETFSIVLVEALAAGCRVVSTDCPVGPREVLKDGALGQLVPVDDPASMADAIVSIYEKRWNQTAVFDPCDYLETTSLDRYERILQQVQNKHGHK